MDRRIAEQLDQTDLLAGYRDQFHLPNGHIYLCGHSLGALPKHTSPHLLKILEQQWGKAGAGAWNSADWINMPQRVSAKLSRLLGTHADEIMVADSTTVNLFKLLIGGLRLCPGRNIILTDSDNFPADLYMAQAVAEQCPDIRVVRCQRTEIPRLLNHKTAILMLTHVDYKTSLMYDIQEMTALAHQVGALALFDLSHSVGLIPLDLNECNVDLAVGCGYKYLNGGPGSPAFMYVARRHHERITSPLLGWMGHASPFTFSPDYVAADGMKRFLCGTPSILAMGALEAAIDLMRQISIADIRVKNQRLGNYFIQLLTKKCPHIEIISPINSKIRGGHVAVMHPHADAMTKSLNIKGILCDYRAPNVIRFGLSPLFVRYVDLFDTVHVLSQLRIDT